MKNLLILAVLFFSFSLCAQTGFYFGTFDPPDTNDIELIRSFLRENEQDMLIVMVDRTHSDGYLASSMERVEMLQVEMLQEEFADIKNRIHIIVEPWSGKEDYLNNSEEDLYLIEKPEKGQPIINNTIKKRRLYTTINSSMARLKRLLYQEAFLAFLRQVSYLHPNENLQNTPLPPFKPLMSCLAWVDQFIYSVIREKHFKGERSNAFGKKAEKLLISSLKGEPYAKLHTIQEVFFNNLPKPLTKHSFFALPVLSKDQKHTLDIETYCSDRFPRALFSSALFQENDTYFHMGTTEEAIAYHQAENFNEIYEVNSQAVRKLRTYHLVKNPETSKVRFIVSNLNGEDTLYHVAYQLNTIAKFQQIHLVRHIKPFPLVEIEPSCSFLSCDTLIIGFKNAISRLILQNPDWHKIAQTSSELDIDLYENVNTKKRIVLAKCVYGDQLLELLNHFYSKGVRRFQYFGTAGSLSPTIHIGDAIIPLAFVIPKNTDLPFPNQAANLLQSINNKKVKLVNLHGWTQSPVLETEFFLKELQTAGAQSIDVEARYFGEFFRQHPEVFASMVLFISDEPFGDITLQHFNAVDHYVDEAFTIVIGALLP